MLTDTDIYTLRKKYIFHEKRLFKKSLIKPSTRKQHLSNYIYIQVHIWNYAYLRVCLFGIAFIRDRIHLGWCLFRIVYIPDDVHSGWCHARWCPFRVVSIGVVSIRDGVY